MLIPVYTSVHKSCWSTDSPEHKKIIDAQHVSSWIYLFLIFPLLGPIAQGGDICVLLLPGSVVNWETGRWEFRARRKGYAGVSLSICDWCVTSWSDCDSGVASSPLVLFQLPQARCWSPAEVTLWAEITQLKGDSDFLLLLLSRWLHCSLFDVSALPKLV